MQLSASTTKFLEQFFSKIVVVSVPRFTARHEKIKQRLNGLAYDFFWGADKLQLDMETIKTDGTYDDAKTKQLHRFGKGLNLGEVACSLSHRMIYEQMIANNWKNVLIFEDDVVPLYENLEQLSQALNELPTDWELLYLGYLKHENVTLGLRVKQFFYKIGSSFGLMKWNSIMIRNLLPKKITPHLKKAGFHDCTHAYAITLEAAKKLVAEQTPVVYRADDLLSYNVMKETIKGFVTEPKFFDQEAFHDQSIVSEIR